MSSSVALVRHLGKTKVVFFYWLAPYAGDNNEDRFAQLQAVPPFSEFMINYIRDMCTVTFCERPTVSDLLKLRQVNPTFRNETALRTVKIT